MNIKILAIVIVLIVVAIDGFLIFKNNSPQSQNYAPTLSSSPEATSILEPSATNQVQKSDISSTPTPIPHAASPTPPVQKTRSFSVTGDDSSGSPTSITVARGDLISIIFNVRSDNVYHGGLDFRSSVVSTGPIAPGSSKTVTFTARGSFSFTPYWPSTGIAKPYTISVVVQ